MTNQPTMICSGCFHDVPQTERCSECGYCERETAPYPLALKPGTMLDAHFLIGKVLGKPGGFGITYLAYDNTLATRVAIKEFLPQELVGRDYNGVNIVPHSSEDGEIFQQGLRSFLDEARTLARFNHSNIIRVKHFFQANGTAYMVMDYYPGMTLLEYIQKREKPLNETEALEIILPVLDGLHNVHKQNIVHRDIKPQNIYLAEDGRRPILLDFGTARSAIGEKNQGLSMLYTPGFAPLEQCQSNGKQGPWTDVYGLSATLYYMLSRTIPEPSLNKKATDSIAPLPGVSAQTQQAIQQGLALNKDERPQSMLALQKLLSNETTGNDSTQITTPATLTSSAASVATNWCVAFYVGLFGLLYYLFKTIFLEPPNAMPEGQAEITAGITSAISTAVYLAVSYTYCRIGRKFGVGNLLGFSIPIYNVVLLCRCAQMSAWLILLCFVPVVGNIVFTVWQVGSIAKRLGKSFWLYGLSYWLLFPILILAFDDSRPVEGAILTGDYEKVNSDEAPLPAATIVEFLSGEYKGEPIEIPSDGLVIGRNPAKANIVINDAIVSGEHLRLSVLPNSECLIEDMASTNGSFYRHSTSGDNWQPLKSLRLGFGEVVWIRLSDKGPELKIY